MNLKISCLFFLSIFYNCAFCQEENTKLQLSDISSKFGNDALKEIFTMDVLDNDMILKSLQSLISKASSNYTFIRELHLKPKAFQTDSMNTSLGFEYKYDNSWNKVKRNLNSLFIQDYKLSFNGNVAFAKNRNPNDFLESSFSYSGAFNWGGQPVDIDDATSDKLEKLEDAILERRKRKESFTDLYKQVGDIVKVSDQFCLGIKGKFAFESNQNFSKYQFAPGVLISMGAKGWNKSEALRYLNILDYPFAIIRLLTGTDDQFNIYGAAFPSVLFGLDYIVPNKDEQRKLLNGNEDPFSRLRFEAAFKTRVAHVGKEIFNFSSNFRWYKELNASAAIKNNSLEASSFFVAAIESNTGFFVSYTTGKLPFDSKSDQVYAIGFKYDLGNSK